MPLAGGVIWVIAPLPHPQALPARCTILVTIYVAERAVGPAADPAADPAAAQHPPRR